MTDFTMQKDADGIATVVSTRADRHLSPHFLSLQHTPARIMQASVHYDRNDR